MAIRRITRKALLEPYLKLLLYGQPGSTKTRTAATAALYEPTSPALMVTVAGNPLSFADYAEIPDIVEFDKLTDFNDLYDWLEAGQPTSHPFPKAYELQSHYKTLIIDGMTEIQRVSFAGVVPGYPTSKPGTYPPQTEIQHYGRVLGQMTNFARLFYKLPMHVILTALEHEQKDDRTGSITLKPFFWGQSSQEVASYAFMVARLVHRASLTGAQKRELKDPAAGVEDTMIENSIAVALLQQTAKYQAKDQYGLPFTYIIDPSVGKIMDGINEARAALSVQE